MTVVRDFDFHPDESTVRVFVSVDVPRLDEEVFVYRVCYGDVVLHHYAWGSRWFKVNVTTSVSGDIVETPATPGVPAFAFNIDIATPMRRHDREVFAVDLFIDLLVRADGVTYVVSDQDEVEHAAAVGLISPRELMAAKDAVAELLDVVERRSLLDLLWEAWPLEPASPAPAPPMQRAPLSEAPVFATGVRSTW